MAARKLTREEAKLITRHRLLEAAADLLGSKGYGGLSTSAIARRAGVAQPTFYVHFRDKDHLLQTLADEKIGGLRRELREARSRLRIGSGPEAMREAFMLPLRTLVENEALFRLFSQAFLQPASSPIGEQARRLHRELQMDLVEDMKSMGFCAVDEPAQERLEMIADAMIAQTEALGMGFVDGRYKSLDAIVDVLTRFTVGMAMLSTDMQGAPA